MQNMPQMWRNREGEEMSEVPINLVRPKSITIDFHTWDAGVSGWNTYPSTITVDLGKNGAVVFHSVHEIKEAGKLMDWLYKVVGAMGIDQREKEKK